MIFKLEDELYDQDLLDLKGNRWNGQPLSKGFGWGKVIKHFGLFMLVKFESYHLPIMFSKEGMRFDRAGHKGSKRALHKVEMDLGLYEKGWKH
jgi:hypothetical protein